MILYDGSISYIYTLQSLTLPLSPSQTPDPYRGLSGGLSHGQLGRSSNSNEYLPNLISQIATSRIFKWLQFVTASFTKYLNLKSEFVICLIGNLNHQ